MGRFIFRLPDIGEGVVEGEIVSWHVSVGDEVTEDQPLVDMMTDKATVTIPSSINGSVLEVAGEAGTMVPVGSMLIILDAEGHETDDDDLGEKESEPLETPSIESADLAKLISQEDDSEENNSADPEQPKEEIPGASSRRPLASPAIRKRASSAGIDLAKVSGSGPAGRITHTDLDAWNLAGAPVSAGGKNRTAKTGIEDIPVVGLRRKIAEQMTTSYTTIPHFSYFEEIDVTNLEELRTHLNSNRPEGTPKLTYLPLIMQALVKALAIRPECNAIYDDQAGVVHRHQAINLGIATQTERGLYVPVVKHVEAKDLWETAAEMLRVTAAAKENTASLEELSGSTFTITSLGRMGGIGATPIINHPEVGILGIHKATEMPVVRNGGVTIRRIMRVSSSWDHRVVDGFDGAMCVQTLKDLLEHPATIFL